MIAAVLLVLTPLLVPVALAECPIEVKSISLYGYVGYGHWSSPVYTDKARMDRRGQEPTHIRIVYTNTSPKVIIAAEFAVTFVDAFDEQHLAEYRFTASEKLKPGKKERGHWEYLFRRPGERADVRVLRVRFEDGEIWDWVKGGICNLGVPGVIEKRTGRSAEAQQWIKEREARKKKEQEEQQK